MAKTLPPERCTACGQPVKALSTIVAVRGMGRSHPNSLRWRCYYAAFERRHNRPSDGHEFDPFVMSLVDAALAVVKNELAVFVDGR